MKGERSKRLNEAFEYVDDELLDIVESERLGKAAAEDDVSTDSAAKTVWDCRESRAVREHDGIEAGRPVISHDRSGRGRWRAAVALAVACLCVFVVLPAGVAAQNWFGLRELILPGTAGDGDGDSLANGDFDGTADGNVAHGSRNENNNGTGDRGWSMDTMISLSGYQGSAEMQALAEWNEFLQSYDVAAAAAQLGNEVFTAPGRDDWTLYQVYSYEMGEKLDEIVSKYGLKLHTASNVVSPEDMQERVGGDFTSERCTMYWGYIYEDGTFHTEIEALLNDGYSVSLQLERTVKGTFHTVMLNIGDYNNYTEWQYETACGETVLLEMGAGKALIFGDFNGCFIMANVLAGSASGLTADGLERIADMIDFKLLKDVKAPEMSGDSVVE